MTVFDTELVFPGGEYGRAPRLSEFLESVMPRLAALYDENGDIGMYALKYFISLKEGSALVSPHY